MTDREIKLYSSCVNFRHIILLLLLVLHLTLSSQRHGNTCRTVHESIRQHEKNVRAGRDDLTSLLKLFDPVLFSSLLQYKLMSVASKNHTCPVLCKETSP